MTPVIHILDAHSANQISAGEVVERPASVVKELVENSIDSGAKHIDITIEGNGVPLIRVRDDGSGIGITDLPLAVIRHATSKISQIEDLNHLQTLGFRGEALPSIASVSHLEISSRPVEEAAGLSLTLHGGKQAELKEIGCPVGTSVTVRDLFYNTPARLKFLKSTPTEFGLISDTIGRIALAHPDIAFSLTHPQQVVLQTTGRGDLREAIGTVLGYDIARQLIPINEQQGKWHLAGFISPPNLVRSSKQAQFFMINGRIVRSPILSRALAEGYHTLIPVKLHPVVVLHLTVSPSDYDVNVHPTKMDVRFKEEQALTQFIRETVYRALINSKPLPSIQTKSSIPPKSQVPLTLAEVPNSKSLTLSPSSYKKIDIRESEAPSLPDMHSKQSNKPHAYEQSQIKFTNQTEILHKSPDTVVPDLKTPAGFEIHKGDQINLYQRDPETVKDYLDIQESSTAQIDAQSTESLSHMWPLTQLFNTYILATDGKVLIMIDQHAAHERVNYERLLREFKQAEQSSQALLIPLPMEFTLQEEQVLIENLWILNEMGFIIEQFGSRTYLLRGVPVQTGSFQADDLLRQFIEEVLLKNSPPTFDKILEEWIYMLACKESIKAKDSLSLPEMEQLMASLSRTENPYTCPHGRPTMVTMTRSELEKRFYRT
ncbi:DNA mismatch repair endonuclease MutL [Desulfosporosinus sp.]|uniref:DNA mismatch repair endonuclease MutL n=1 Tax=Desulfosporosinus sp. TaxID=157907 RepID=UPI00262C108B|nr:DNA mismatch repair endonuclease MutL [Desulfosporosinus sp.]